ncbi:methyltransferase [bacterium]|nr:methyltransferase [bacterium]
MAAERSPGRVLIVNDAFGALAVGLAAHAPTVWSDAHPSELAIAHNLVANGLEAGSVPFVPADRAPEGAFDLVLARFPKSLAFWEDTLLRLRAHLAADARILAGGMIKHTPRRAFDLMDHVLGPTRTTRGWKKARLAEATFDPERDLPARLPDATWTLDDPPLLVRSGPNVFARDRLDTGSRALLPHLPRDTTGRLADLGCGNGVLALVLAVRNPAAEVLGVDTSYQAIASARANASAAGLGAPRLDFAVADGLRSEPPAALDLVVCNPPFHQDRTVGDMLAWRMFTQAERALRAGGRLLVVGNTHLDHGERLARIFGRCRQLARSGKFEVLEAERHA